MSFKNSNRLKMAALLLASTVSAVAFAQNAPDAAGVVRISDQRPRANARSAGSLQQVSACENGAGMNGVAGDGSCPPGGNGMSGYCPGGYPCRGGHCPHGLFGCCNEYYCKHSPDYGYSPPAKYPLHRRGVEYTRYFPNQWYGAGADYSQANYPMVYAPTDTTQLGYYYQHVPYWQPMPGRIPERPIPSQWHIVAPPVSASNFCGPCYALSPYYYHNRCRFRAYHRWGVPGYEAYGDDWCPADGYPSNGQPTPQGTGPTTSPVEAQPFNPGVAPMPVETQTPSPLPLGEAEAMDDFPSSPVPPPAGAPQRIPARQDSASSGHIRRLGYSN